MFQVAASTCASCVAPILETAVVFPRLAIPFGLPRRLSTKAAKATLTAAAH
jgi:hypothetical protein